MAHRRVQPEVQKLFEKYVTNDQHVRRLDDEGALQLMQNEFQLDKKSARALIDYFDTDCNGELSLWEFQHFYNLAGTRVAATAAKFDELDTGNEGFLSREAAMAAIKDMKSADDKDLEEKDIQMLLKSAKDENQIFLGDYIAILYRVKMYKKGR